MDRYIIKQSDCIQFADTHIRIFLKGLY